MGKLREPPRCLVSSLILALFFPRRCGLFLVCEIINMCAFSATAGPIKGCNQDHISQQEVLEQLFLTLMSSFSTARWGRHKKTTCLKDSKTFMMLPFQQRELCIFTGPSGNNDDSEVSPK